MHNEKVFTPEWVVTEMLTNLSYKGENIRKKHIIDNSCGDGAILKEVVKRYIKQCIKENVPNEIIKQELETYIHGIELDFDLVIKTKDILNNVACHYSLYSVNWNIEYDDAMYNHNFDNKMDYVIGNPPYCNIHHIEEDKREDVKKYRFANGGMTDMYLVFFEIGINMLNEYGKLAYITPNSWLTSKAGTNFRNYIFEEKTLYALTQFGEYKVFPKVNTYTCITYLSKRHKGDETFLSTRFIVDNSKIQIAHVKETLSNVTNDGNIYITDKNSLESVKAINDKYNDLRKNKKLYLSVKNGFATLNDEFFIIDDFVKENDLCENIISVMKASNSDRHYFFFPYDRDGKPLDLSQINEKLVSYMRKKAVSMKIDIDNNDKWYLYGRTQALNDVKYPKVIVNNLIRSVEDIKIDLINENEGIYSGYYIPLTDYNIKYQDIVRFLKSNCFLEYIKAVGKYKNGGYYTFSSKELEKYLNYSVFEREIYELINLTL